MMDNYDRSKVLELAVQCKNIGSVTPLDNWISDTLELYTSNEKLLEVLYSKIKVGIEVVQDLNQRLNSGRDIALETKKFGYEAVISVCLQIIDELKIIAGNGDPELEKTARHIVNMD